MGSYLMFKEVEFRKMKKLLESLGFDIRMKGSHIVCKHNTSNLLLALASQKGAIPKYQVAYVRKMLIDNGLISDEDFEKNVK